MITTKTFFKRAAFAPYVVTIVAELASLAMSGVRFDSKLVQVGSLIPFIGVIGLYAVFSYTIFLH